MERTHVKLLLAFVFMNSNFEKYRASKLCGFIILFITSTCISFIGCDKKKEGGLVIFSSLEINNFVLGNIAIAFRSVCYRAYFNLAILASTTKIC